jgi:hypothetical protein
MMVPVLNWRCAITDYATPQLSSLRTQGPIRRAVNVADGAKAFVEPARHHDSRLGLWIPAFAGTTTRDSQSARFANAAPRSRGADAPGVLQTVSPKENKGRREDRVRAAPAVSCAKMCEKTAHEHTGSAEASGLPCAMVLRLMPRSPRRRIRFVTVIDGLKVLPRPVGSGKPPPT